MKKKLLLLCLIFLSIGDSLWASNSCNKLFKNITSNENNSEINRDFFDLFLFNKSKNILQEVSPEFVDKFDEIYADIKKFKFLASGYHGSKELYHISERLHDILNNENYPVLSKIIEEIYKTPQFQESYVKARPRDWKVSVFYDDFNTGDLSLNAPNTFHLDDDKSGTLNGIIINNNKLELFRDEDIHEKSKTFILNLVEKGKENPAPTRFVKSFPNEKDLEKLIIRSARTLNKSGVKGKAGTHIGHLINQINGLNPTLLKDYVQEAPSNRWVSLERLQIHNRTPAKFSGRRIFIRISSWN